MQHDLDYDRAWDKFGKRFWRRRRREVAVHFAFFVGAHIMAFFIRDFLGTTFSSNYSPFAFMQYLGIDNLAYSTVNWGILITIHMVALIGIAIGERIFRYSVERELLRDFAQVNHLDEKRKMRPSYVALSEDDEAFDVIDEAQAISSRQSAR